MVDSVTTARAQNYTDIQGVGALRKGAENYDESTMRTVAKQFESLFMQMMLKSMREATPKEGLFDSDASQTYLDLHDKQLASDLSTKGHGLGLAEMIYQQMVQNRPGYTPPERQLAAPERDSSLGSFQPPLATVMAADAEPKASLSERPAIASEEEPPEPLSPLTLTALPQRFDSPAEFIEAMLPLARRVASELGVEPKALVAQAALETGWGRAVIRRADGNSSFNLFNIKADSRWQGESVVKASLEFDQGVAAPVRSPFRAYGSYEESFADYADFIQRNPRYSEALKAAPDAAAYVTELQQAGYATDPNYASKIHAIMARPEFGQRTELADSGHRVSHWR
ncbi:flagellar assembly peptidoglycan hydrolase FlgJ [Ectothiorhodospiraceae bacterium BW-2]|nr:flagellar assembly peptidoglycan hydrolase FlgJ [Ectothiorhodospiraceae bacterium BW-2]